MINCPLCHSKLKNTDYGLHCNNKIDNNEHAFFLELENNKDFYLMIFNKTTHPIYNIGKVNEHFYLNLNKYNGNIRIPPFEPCEILSVLHRYLKLLAFK